MKVKLSQPQFIYELGKRNNQEDSIFPGAGTATVTDKLFIVCDGMGGHEHGELASRLVCETFSNYVQENVDDDTVFTDEMFNEALEKAYLALDEADQRTSARKMGTTLTFILFHKGGCFMAHIGDSRIYHLRPEENRFLYMSRDHSLVFELFRSGEISYDEMKTHARKNIITRAMMPGEDNRVAADTVNTTDIAPGDYFYMCSDGMLEQSEESDIMGILSSENDDTSKQQRFISATLDNKDNHSAYIIRVEDVEKEEGDEEFRNDESSARSNVVNYIPELNKKAVTKVASGDFVSDAPVKEKPKKKFPWVKIMLVLIAAAGYLLFRYVPSLRDKRVQDWEKNQDKSTIVDTLSGKQNMDEKVYGSDSLNNNENKQQETVNSGKEKQKQGSTRAAGNKQNNKPKQVNNQQAEKPKTQQQQKPKPQAQPQQPAQTQAQPQAEPQSQPQQSAQTPSQPSAPVSTPTQQQTSSPATQQEAPPTQIDNNFQ